MNTVHDREDELVLDLLHMPTDRAFKVSVGVVVMISIFTILGVTDAGMEAVLSLSPFYCGLVIGFSAHRRPERTVTAIGLLTNLALTSHALDWDSSDVVFFGVLSIWLGCIGAFRAATIRRWVRGRMAQAELVP